MITPKLISTICLFGEMGIISVLFSVLKLGADETDTAPETVNLSPIWVTAESDDSNFTDFTISGSWEDKTGNFSTVVDDCPGVSMIQRGSGASEPMIRGLTSDRVSTTFNGMRLPNASPTRTHSPVNMFGIIDGLSLAINTAIPSLTLGPPVSGGWIRIDGSNQSEANTQPAAIALSWVPDRDAANANLTFRKLMTDGKFGIQGNVYQLRSGNYSSADEIRVPSHILNWGSSLESSFRLKSDWQHRVSMQFQHQDLVENASLPLDTVDGDFLALTVVHEKLVPNHEDWALRLRYGYAKNDDRLDNSRRGASPMLISNDARTRTWHADLQWKNRFAGDDLIQIGLDGNQERKLAIRQRGTVGKDYIWPDTLNKQIGLFIESTSYWGESTTMRLGARWDSIQTIARMADEMAFGHVISNLYERYSPDGDSVSNQKNHSNLSANALLQHNLGNRWSIYTGFSSVAQEPGSTERYRAFLNALGGGYEIGNPSLEPERKWEWSGGIRYHQEHGFVQFEAFASHIQDFQWREVVGNTAGVLPLPMPQTVFSYRNVDANFNGLEVSGSVRIGRGWYVPFSLEWVEAKLDSDGTGYSKGDSLPEIPPATIRLSLQKQGSIGRDHQWMLKMTGNWTAARSNPLPAVDPIYRDSDSYLLMDLKGIWTYMEHLQMGIQFSNLLNKSWVGYLTPPAGGTISPESDIKTGDSIPGAGREIAFSVSYLF